MPFFRTPETTQAVGQNVSVRSGRGWSMCRLRLTPEARLDTLPPVVPSEPRQSATVVKPCRTMIRTFLSSGVRRRCEKKYLSPPSPQDPARSAHANILTDPRDETSHRRLPSCKDLRRNQHLAALHTRPEAPAARPEDAKASFRSRGRRVVRLAKPLPASALRPSPPSGLGRSGPLQRAPAAPRRMKTSTPEGKGGQLVARHPGISGPADSA